jgi:hypothetical protein
MGAIYRRFAVFVGLVVGLLVPAAGIANNGPIYWVFRSDPIAVGGGWKAYVISGHEAKNGDFAISFAKGNRVVRFTPAMATVTGTADDSETIDATLGKLGSVHMTFSPSGPARKVCGVASTEGRAGKLTGTLHLDGGKTFKLDAGSIAGKLADYDNAMSMTSFCATSGLSNPVSSFSASGHSKGVRRVLSASKSKSGKVYLFGSLSRTLADGLVELSTIGQIGAGSHFSAASDLSSATVEGGGVFSGTVMFHKKKKLNAGFATGTVTGKISATFEDFGNRKVAASGDPAELSKGF